MSGPMGATAPGGLEARRVVQIIGMARELRRRLLVLRLSSEKSLQPTPSERSALVLPTRTNGQEAQCVLRVALLARWDDVAGRPGLTPA
jgi:hypothetical protein